MFLEVPEEDDEDQPCQACGEDDNEDVLMYCDACQKLWHTYCVDLQEVPHGHWFCDHCRARRDVDPRQSRNLRAQRSVRRRTRGQQRRQRSQQVAQASGWAQVWQSVWDRINLDLDFPYDDDDTSATAIRRHRQHSQSNRQAHEAWRRRAQVAEMQGAGTRFRQTESALLDVTTGTSATSRRQSPPVQAQTADETAGWLAFDQARAAESDKKTTRRGKKRKSATTSPSEQEESGVEAVKRRRLSAEASSRPTASTVAPSRVLRLPRAHPPTSRSSVRLIDTGGPSFLQSLLQEVEDSSSTVNHIPLYRPLARNPNSPPAEQQSPQPSSPALSPMPSNHSSPRALSATPPPPGSARPSSPTGLSSSIFPIFPPTEYSPSRSSPEPRSDSPERRGRILRDKKKPSTHNVSAVSSRARSRVLPSTDKAGQQSKPTGRSRSCDASPTQNLLSLGAKTDVQRLVAAALKPYYHGHKITTDEYTTINKNVSRILYDKVGEEQSSKKLAEDLSDTEKMKWETTAKELVDKAVSQILASKRAQLDFDAQQDGGGDSFHEQSQRTPKEILVPAA